MVSGHLYTCKTYFRLMTEYRRVQYYIYNRYICVIDYFHTETFTIDCEFGSTFNYCYFTCIVQVNQPLFVYILSLPLL